MVVENVDLSGGAASEQSWESDLLDPGMYNFLGFFDVDENADPADEAPDNGDPVTLAVTNTFEIEAGETTEYEAQFNLVF